MDDNCKYISVDGDIVNDNVLLLNKILHTVNTFKIDNFYLVTDNDPEKIITDDEGKIISVSDDGEIYIAFKSDDEDTFKIIEIIDNELEYNDEVLKKYDIINFNLSGITCKGMIIDFNSCDDVIYIETLVNNDDGLSVIYLYLEDDANIKVLEPMDSDIIDKLIEKLD